MVSSIWRKMTVHCHGGSSLSPPSMFTKQLQWSHQANSLLTPVQRKTHLCEDWQIDFNKMPPAHDYKYLIFFVDSFTGWIEALPTRTERHKEPKLNYSFLSPCMPLSDLSHWGKVKRLMTNLRKF